LAETEGSGRYLQKLKERMKRIKDLLEELEKNVEESEEKFKELDLPEMSKAENKKVGQIMQHLARANMLVVFANTANFRNLVKRISDETGDILERLEEELDAAKRKIE